MNLTISHSSALRVLRRLRAEGVNIRRDLDASSLVRIDPRGGRRWSAKEFDRVGWKWGVPKVGEPLHALVPDVQGRVRSRIVRCHVAPDCLPAGSVLWLDENANVVSPGLLFVQMSRRSSLRDLVMLGNELCGCFSCDADNPSSLDPTLGIAPAITVHELREFVRSMKGCWGMGRARAAVEHVVDNCWSVQEATLAAMYCLPVEEGGYGMGPVVLNDCVVIAKDEWGRAQSTRFPDIMFSFAPVGINYDGGDHLDLQGLVVASERAFAARYGSSSESMDETAAALVAKKAEVRAKVVDDKRRDRALIASGKIVLPLTKEDVYDFGSLDEFTRQLLRCAATYFGVDTSRYEACLDDSEACRERFATLAALKPSRFDAC